MSVMKKPSYEKADDSVPLWRPTDTATTVSGIPRLTPDATLQTMDESENQMFLTQEVAPRRILGETALTAKDDP
jgi:hypothetical protein